MATAAHPPDAGPHLPGHALHVIRRGVLRRPCFPGEDDRGDFLRSLGRLAAAEGCAVHAYALMGNHVHLLVTPSRAPSVARLMRALASPLWDARYEAWPVHQRRYLLACMRYIELNPVRAGIVPGAGDYPWSSYAANALGEDNPLLTPHPHYVALGRSPAARRAAYRALFVPKVRARAGCG